MVKKWVCILIIHSLVILNLLSQYTIAGKVKSNDSNEDIAFSTVVFHNIDDTIVKPIMIITDEKGNFKIDDISQGEYILTVSSIGYRNKIFTVNTSSFDGHNQYIRIDLDPKLYKIDELQVKSLRQNIILKKVPLPITVITDANIKKESSATLSDLLNREAGLAIQRDGIWATSIIIRGLSEQRIVTLIDGNRIETANDLAAGLSMIDINEIERIEVVKGALSSIYGTGAMGGIINIITKKGYYNNSLYVKGKLSSSFHSVNELYDNHVKIFIGHRKWYTTIGGTVQNAIDTKTPEGILNNSQYRDDNISFNTTINPFRNQELIVDFQRYTAHNVGIPGGNALPPAATAVYPVEKRILFSSEYRIRNLSKSLQSFSLKYYNQYILRDVLNIPNIPVHTVVLNADSILNVQVNKITPSGKHYTQGIQAQADWKPGNKNNIIFGFDGWQRELKTEREKYITQEITDSSDHVLLTTEIVRGEIPIPKSVFRSIGFFIQEKYVPNDKFTVIIGGRIDLINVINDQVTDPYYLIVNNNMNTLPPNQRITFNKGNKNDISWSTTIGAQYNITNNLYSTFSFGRAFRSPSLEERYKYIDLGTMVRVGDPDLKPERGYLFDAGLKFYHQKFHLEINGFLNIMNNLIIEKSGEYIYNTVNNIELFDTIPALVNANVNEAHLFGTEITFRFNICNNIIVFGNTGYTIGKDITNDDFLPLIPPVKGVIGLEYTKPKWFSTSMECFYAGKQNKAAVGETNTNGYVILNFKLNSANLNLYKFNIQLISGIQNILNKAYTNHLSSNRGEVTIEPGRNIYIKTTISF